MVMRSTPGGLEARSIALIKTIREMTAVDQRVIKPDPSRKKKLLASSWEIDFPNYLTDILINKITIGNYPEEFLSQLRTLLTGIDPDTLATYSKDMIEQHAVSVQLYDMVAILTQAIFQASGALNPEMLILIKNHLDIPEEVEAKIASGDNQDAIARAILQAFLFKYMDGSLAMLGIKSEKVTSLRKQIFHQDHRIPLAEICSFAAHYRALNAAIYNFLTTLARGNPGQKYTNMHRILLENSSTNWDAVQDVAKDYNSWLITRAPTEWATLKMQADVVREFTLFTGIKKASPGRLEKITASFTAFTLRRSTSVQLPLSPPASAAESRAESTVQRHERNPQGAPLSTSLLSSHSGSSELLFLLDADSGQLEVSQPNLSHHRRDGLTSPQSAPPFGQLPHHKLSLVFGSTLPVTHEHPFRPSTAPSASASAAEEEEMHF